MFSREWRNWQTRTFEGRVIPSYGFKSRLSHQKKALAKASAFFYPSHRLGMASRISVHGIAARRMASPKVYLS